MRQQTQTKIAEESERTGLQFDNWAPVSRDTVVPRTNDLFLEKWKTSFRDDREEILASVKQYGENLCNASPQQQNDKEIVLAAVQNYGLALRYASPALRNDREVFVFYV